MIPRIRGRVGKGDDDKYYFEIGLWNLAGTQQMGDPFTLGPFETEKIAHEELKRATQLVCESIEKSAGQEPSGQYLDLKDGAVLKPWLKH